MRRSLALAALVALLAAACGTTEDAPPAVEAESPAVKAEGQRTKASVNWHPQSEQEGEVKGATATLKTTESEATLKVDTRELNPGHAVTLWFVIINNPEACEAHPEPCVAADVLGNPEADAQVAFGDGLVVDENGRAKFSASFEAGPVPGGWYEGREFVDPQTAEIQFSLNDHGPVIEEFMPEMTKTYRAGCTDESLVEAFPDTAKADGEPGPNTCRLWQSGVLQQ